jgi:hypothetical protein
MLLKYRGIKMNSIYLALLVATSTTGVQAQSEQMYACPSDSNYMSVSFADGDSLQPYSETIRGAEIALDDSKGVRTFDGIEYVYAYVFVHQNADGTYRTADGWVKQSEVASSCN